MPGATAVRSPRSTYHSPSGAWKTGRRGCGVAPKGASGVWPARAASSSSITGSLREASGAGPRSVPGQPHRARSRGGRRGRRARRASDRPRRGTRGGRRHRRGRRGGVAHQRFCRGPCRSVGRVGLSRGTASRNHYYVPVRNSSNEEHPPCRLEGLRRRVEGPTRRVADHRCVAPRRTPPARAP